MKLVRILLPGLLSLALTLALSGCIGGGSRAHVQLDAVASAIEPTQADNTMRMSMTVSMELPPPVGTLTVSGVGAVDTTRNLTQMSTDMSSFASHIGVGGSGLSLSPTDWNIEMVAQGTVLYMRMPFLTKLARLDKPWVKLDYQQGLQQMGIDMSSLMNVGGSDPSQSLQYLLGSERAVNLGPETIGGVRTTHWRTIVDFDLYLDRLPANRRDATKKALDALKNLTHPVYDPFDVWIDAKNRVRQETFGFSYETQGQHVKMTETARYFDFGRPVSIALPGPDEVTDLTALASAGR